MTGAVVDGLGGFAVAGFVPIKWREYHFDQALVGGQCGKREVEEHRQNPRVEPGAFALVDGGDPERAVGGAGQQERSDEDQQGFLWQRVGQRLRQAKGGPPKQPQDGRQKKLADCTEKERLEAENLLCGELLP